MSHKSDPGASFFKARGGFTMVEVLAATAIMGILALPLLTVTNVVTRSLHSDSAQFEMMVELKIASQIIKRDLRSLFRPEHIIYEDPVEAGFRFKGEGGAFVYGTSTDQGNCDGQDSDRLATYLSDFAAFNAEGEPASERRSLALHISPAGESLDHCVLRRRALVHDEADLNDDRLFPDFDDNWDNEDGTPNMQGVAAGSFIDYLSFQFYDGESGQWVDTWDSDNHAGQLPDAVEYALRAYDPEGNVEPVWHRDKINLKRIE